MITFGGRGILLDVEGTTSSIRFVYDVMFPFVRRELDTFLAAHWGQAELGAACDRIARDAGHTDLAAWRASARVSPEDEEAARYLVRGEVLRLMDGDVKATGLKQVQGLIWQSGFAGGELKAHVYDEVPAALRDWNARGVDVRIYSSGSIHAQTLFFGHTIAGNLLPLLKGHYDTTTGPKQQADSYRRIAAAFGLPPADILFLSDVMAELEAARTAGLATALVLRPGNAPVPAGHGHAEITSFADIAVMPAGV